MANKTATKTAAPAAFLCDCGREFASEVSLKMHRTRSVATAAHREAVAANASATERNAEALAPAAVEVAPVAAPELPPVNPSVATLDEVAARKAEAEAHDAAMFDKLSRKCEGLISERDALRAEVESLRTELREARKAKTNRAADVDEARANAARERREADSLHAERGALAGALDGAGVPVEDYTLTARVAALVSERNAARAALAQSDRACAAAEGTAAGLRVRCAELESEAGEARATLATFKAGHAATLAERDAKAGALDAAREALGKWNDPFRSVANCIEALRAAIGSVPADATTAELRDALLARTAERDEARRGLERIADAWALAKRTVRATVASAPRSPGKAPAAPRPMPAPDSAPGALPSDASAPSATAAEAIKAPPGKRLQRCVCCGELRNAKRGEKCDPCKAENRDVMTPAQWAELTEAKRRGTKMTGLERR